MKRVAMLALFLLFSLAAAIFLRPTASSQSSDTTVSEIAKPAEFKKTTEHAPKVISPRAKTVRVAAIQCASTMGKVARNRQMLSDLITSAAAQGAKICVLPECALQGYMNPRTDKKWSKDPAPDEGDLAVSVVAENIPRPSTRHFSALARQLEIYIALPLIEADDGAYYNSLVLIDPRGEFAAKHRKHALWPPGDATWASEGKGPAAVAATPYGRLGLMVCYDVHEMPQKLKAARADIVLYAVGWYGPSEIFFTELFPRRYVVPNGFSVVAANWSGAPGETEWDGLGFRCVIDKRGVVLAMAKTTTGSEIVIADLPVGETGVVETSDE